MGGIMTPHNDAKKEDIASVVIMPGDPLRAKYIAENFLEDCKLVNSVRNMFAYTGLYKGKKITVMASGMGMPSMGIYCYELYKFYDVETIIRIGSCGVYDSNINLLETILVDGSYTFGNFALNMANDSTKFVCADEGVNVAIQDVAKKMNIDIRKENMACVECFDAYVDNIDDVIQKFPADKNIVGAEMEAFALFYTARKLNKKAACLLTVVDVINKEGHLTSEERQLSLDNMIRISINSAIKLT